MKRMSGSVVREVVWLDEADECSVVCGRFGGVKRTSAAMSAGRFGWTKRTSGSDVREVVWLDEADER